MEVRVPSYADRLKGKARSVADFAFYSRWKDRTDIGCAGLTTRGGSGVSLVRHGLPMANRW